MKKALGVFLASLAVLMSLQGGALAEPNVIIWSQEYIDNTSGERQKIDDLMAIEPYRTVRIAVQYPDTAVATAVSNINVSSNDVLNGLNPGTKIKTLRFELESEQTGLISVSVVDVDGSSKVFPIEVKAVAKVKPVYPVTGIGIYDFWGADQTPQKTISVSIEKGNSTSIVYVIEPANATNRKVNYTVSAQNVVKLTPKEEDSRFLAETAGTGTTLITFRTEDGDFTATCNFTVTDSSPSLNPESGNGGGGGCDALGLGLMFITLAALPAMRKRHK